MMKGLMHGVEGIRTTAEGMDKASLQAWLTDVHPEMVALHVDGFDTVGALRAVVAWADGKVVRGSSTWDVGRTNDFDARSLALHAEAWHVAMPAFHVWGVDAAKWQDRGMLHVDALGAMLQCCEIGTASPAGSGVVPRGRRQARHAAAGVWYRCVDPCGHGPCGPCPLVSFAS